MKIQKICREACSTSKNFPTEFADYPEQMIFSVISPFCPKILKIPTYRRNWRKNLQGNSILSVSGAKPIRTRTRQNDFNFFRSWDPSVFHLLKPIFLGTYWSDSSHFCINTTMGSRSIVFQTFRSRKCFFWSVISHKNVNFPIFLESKVYIFESCLYSNFVEASVLALIDGRPFSWAACCDTLSLLNFDAHFPRTHL